MNNNFSFKIFNQLEDKLKEDWLALEQNSNFFFFQKYYYAKNLIEVFKINLFFIQLKIKRYLKGKQLQFLVVVTVHLIGRSNYLIIQRLI